MLLLSDNIFKGYLSDGATLHWSEVTASSLIGLDSEGHVKEEGNLGGSPELSAACIHLGVRRVRKDAKVLCPAEIGPRGRQLVD